MLRCYERIILLCGNPRGARNNSRRRNYVCSRQSHEQRGDTPRWRSPRFQSLTCGSDTPTCKVYVRAEVKGLEMI